MSKVWSKTEIEHEKADLISLLKIRTQTPLAVNL